MITFEQSRNIYDYKPVLSGLVEDFGIIFYQTMMEWCNVIHDDYDSFWELWLIKIDNNPIGVCGLYSLDSKTDELWLGWLGIIPEYRNRNIGSDILSFLYQECRKVNCKVIYSYVDKDGKPLNFYKRNGFEVISTVREFLENNNMNKIDGDAFEDMEDWVIRKPVN